MTIRDLTYRFISVFVLLFVIVSSFFSVLGTLHHIFAEKALNSFVLKNSRYRMGKAVKISFKTYLAFLHTLSR